MIILICQMISSFTLDSSFFRNSIIGFSCSMGAKIMERTEGRNKPMNGNRFIYFQLTLSILILLTVLPGFVLADVFIKQEIRTEPVYHHGNVEAGSTSVIEFWIGEGKLAYKEGTTGLIVDQAAGKAFFLNHGTKTFAETVLPFQLENIADAEFAQRLKMFRMQGAIKPLDKEKKIKDLICKMMEISTWYNYEGVRYYETISEACLATALPFDYKSARGLLKEIQSLNNFDEGINKEMLALEGFLIESTSTRYMEGTPFPSKLETVEMAVKEPPQGTYAIPEGFTKKEKLSRDEVMGR